MMRMPLTIVVLLLAALLPAQERRRPGPERAPTERAQREHRELPRGERGEPRREMLMERLRHLRDRIDQVLERREGQAPMRSRGPERRGALRGGHGLGRGEARPARPFAPPRERANRGRGRGGEPDLGRSVEQGAER
jgi:hypothetical protein